MDLDDDLVIDEDVLNGFHDSGTKWFYPALACEVVGPDDNPAGACSRRTLVCVFWTSSSCLLRPEVEDWAMLQ